MKERPVMKSADHLSRRSFVKRVGLATSASWLAASRLTVGQAAPETQPGAHRITTCNIRLPLAADDQEGNGWEARKEMCLDIIAGRRPDVICLQECYGTQLDYFKSRLPGFEAYGMANPGPVFNPLNTILFSRSRYTMISAGGFWLSQTPHIAGTKSWDSSHSRFVNWVDLKVRQSGQVFRVWNTHLDHIGHVAREEQARMITEAARAFPEGLPQILTGDMNANPTHPAIKLLKREGWIDLYGLVHGQEGPAFTFHAFWGPEYDTKAAPGRVRGQIDWIFGRGPVKALAAEVVRDGRNGRYPSDHYFISADVAI
jgi:endonuclease/exonuclease/phosphatase family metal-dependent hydrolase